MLGAGLAGAVILFKVIADCSQPSCTYQVITPIVGVLFTVVAIAGAGLLVRAYILPLGDRRYLLSPQDLAAYDLIDDLVAKGSIPFTKVGDRLVFSKAALDYWIYAKSMENLKDDLPNLGFQGRKAG